MSPSPPAAPRRVDVAVEPVRSRGARRRFIDVPFRLHAGDPRWVPPLRAAVADRISPRHPAASHQEWDLWVARRDGEAVGRIGACRDAMFDDLHGERWGWTGFFECADDPDAARALFEAAWEWSAARGAEECVGPASFTTNDECGLLVEGFENPPMVLTPWNPPYYEALWRGAGWEPATDLFGWLIDRSVTMSERQARVLRRVRERAGFTVREVRMRDFEAEVARFFSIYRSAWSRNWGFAPMTEEEVRHVARDLKRIIDPRFALFVENDEGETVATALVLPDINEVMPRLPSGRLLPLGWLRLLRGARRTRGIRIIALGVRPDHETRAVGPLLYGEIIERGLGTARLDRCEASWVLEDNEAMNRAISDTGARRWKTWRMFRRPLGA